jgi:hypothetical protein
MRAGDGGDRAVTVQPVPAYADADLDRVIARDFPEPLRARAFALLEAYGKEAWQKPPLRVRMACVKLAGGDLAQLGEYVGFACRDSRDVLAWAEYPRYFTATTEQERQRAIEAGWRELQSWLRS